MFKSLNDAVAAKAKAMQVDPKVLLKRFQGTRKKLGREEPPKYRGVTRVQKVSGVYWQAWAPRSCGRKAGRAADFLEHVGEPPTKKHRHDWFDVERQRQHFKALMKIYTHKDGHPYLPSDLQYNIELGPVCKEMCEHAPALLYIALMSKYRAFKERLAAKFAVACDIAVTCSQPIPVQHANSLQPLQSTASKLCIKSLKNMTLHELTDGDVECLIQIAQVSFQDIVGIDFTAWVANVGRGNCFYSSPTILLGRFLA